MKIYDNQQKAENGVIYLPTGYVSERFLKNSINRFKWLAQSPDINPIEHIWDELKRRLRPHSPKNKDKLWSIMEQEWRGIGREETSKLANSLSKRLQEILKDSGEPMRYYYLINNNM